MMPVPSWAAARRRRSGVARLCALLPVLALLGACSTLFGDKDDVAPDVPADRLYNEGVYLLNEKNKLGDAAKKFEEVDRQHPYSEWARKSLLMSAYAYYEGHQYEESIAAARRYVSLHPGRADAAFAQYLMRASHFDQIPDVTRDQTRAERAIA